MIRQPRSVVCAILALGGLFLAAGGCTDLKLFNSQFLNDYKPFGIDDLINIEPQGPVIVVIENLTGAACDGEYVEATVSWTGSQTGSTGAGSVYLPFIPAVREQDRAADASFRQDVVLNCKDVDNITVRARIHRVSISEEDKAGWQEEGSLRWNITTGPNAGESREFRRGRFVGTTEVDNATLIVTISGPVAVVERDMEETVVADASRAIMQRNSQFECGSVLVFGVLEEIRPDGSVQLRRTRYQFASMTLTQQLVTCARGGTAQLFTSPQRTEDTPNPTLVPVTTVTSDFNDPTRELINLIYPYPDRYVVLGVTLQQLANIDTAGQILKSQAAALAAQEQ